MICGLLKEDFTTSVTVIGDCVVIKHVLCYKYAQCDEAAYNGETMEPVEQIVDPLRESVTEVAIVNCLCRVA